MDYKPSGVCSRLIHVELDGDKIANVEFVGDVPEIQPESAAL